MADFDLVARIDDSAPHVYLVAVSLIPSEREGNAEIFTEVRSSLPLARQAQDELVGRIRMRVHIRGDRVLTVLTDTRLQA